jgi:hypothetical protein
MTIEDFETRIDATRPTDVKAPLSKRYGAGINSQPDLFREQQP